MTTTKKINITMSEQAPVTLDPEQWPCIAEATDHDGQVECQANTEWAIYVREHEDGRRLVYGWEERGTGGKPITWRPTYVGWMIPGGEPRRDAETARAIRRVAGAIHNEGLGAVCLADMPAQEI
jgi:hypothetical protein